MILVVGKTDKAVFFITTFPLFLLIQTASVYEESYGSVVSVHFFYCMWNS